MQNGTSALTPDAEALNKEDAMAMFAALNVSQDQTAICMNGPCAASSVPKNTVKPGRFFQLC
jgi:hypothetical protein